MDQEPHQEGNARAEARGAAPGDWPRQHWALLHAAEVPSILACLLAHGGVPAEQLHGLRRVNKAWLAAVNTGLKSITLHATAVGPQWPFFELRHLTLEGRNTVDSLFCNAHHSAHQRAAMRLQRQAHLLSTFSGQHLQHLRSLHLQNCDSMVFRPLTRVTEDAISVPLLPSLHTLQMSCCWLGYTGGWLPQLSGLQELQLVRCYTGDSDQRPVPELWLEAIVQLTSLTSLRLVRLNGGAPARLPNGVSALMHLEQLAFTHSTHRWPLPDVLLTLTRLKSLDLSHCKYLKDVPASIDALVGLTSLRLQGCEYLTIDIPTLLRSSMPVQQALPQLKSLTSLVHLDLSHTSIWAAPVALCALTALTYLDLTHTAGFEFPDAVLHCTSLCTLALGFTRDGTIMSQDLDLVVPDTISALQRLRHLSCVPGTIEVCRGLLHLSTLETITADIIWGDAVLLKQLTSKDVQLHGQCGILE